MTDPSVPEPTSPDPESAAEGPAPLAARASSLARRLAEEAADAASRGREVLEGVSERAQTLWTAEDPAVILGSPSFAPFPSGDRAAEMLSVSWRADALLGLSAMGLTVWEREVVQVTRAIFHDGPSHQEVSRRLFGSDLDSIHRWIDTVPGSGIRGGGILHRLQHGHDLGAAQQLYDQHGIPGLLAWMQHVSQDVMTPTGVPIPVGATRLSAWLVDEGYATPGKAALMLSFNVAELAAAVLGSAFALRLASLLAEVRRQRRVARRCAEAQEAWRKGDLDAVVALYGEARSLSADDPGIVLAQGWAYAQMGRPAAEAFLAFRTAAQGLATSDRTVDVGGAAVSLRGVAYLLALSHAVQVLEEDGLRGAWRDEMDRMLRGAVSAFESTAIAQVERPALRLAARELPLRRTRTLSAAANYYLAARTTRSAPFLPGASEAARLSGRSLEMLERGAEAYPEAAAQVEDTRIRWELELAPRALHPTRL